MASVVVGGEVRNIDIRQLDLDADNPRFTSPLPSKASREDIALYMDRHFDPLRVADSISRHGFFVSEPLIAIENGSRYIVVEGNRRLTALLALADPALKARLAEQTKGWGGLSSIPAPVVVPVVVIGTRHEVDALLGFRHISGIEPWDPFAQAKFVDDMLAREPDFGVVAQRVGRSESAVRAMFRDFDLLRQAEEEFGLDISRARDSFGVFNAAMGVVNIREFIGASAPRGVSLDHWPISLDMGPQMARLLVYIFGSDSTGSGKVINESRELRKLGQALVSSPAEAALREGASLDEALQKKIPLDTQIKITLDRATIAMAAAFDLLGEYGRADANIGEAVDRCKVASDELLDLYAGLH